MDDLAELRFAHRGVPNRLPVVPGQRVAEIERVVDERGVFAVVERRVAA